MHHEEQRLLINAVKGMQVVNDQVNLLLDGFEYLVSTVSEHDSSNFFKRQISDASTSMKELSEQMVLIKRLVTSINNGQPLFKNKPFKLEIVSEMILHMGMIRNLLKDYEIHPEGYNAVNVANAVIDIRKCLMHY